MLYDQIKFKKINTKMKKSCLFGLILFFLTTTLSYAKDCEIEIRYKKAGSTNTSVSVTGINKGKNKNINKNNLRYLKNLKSHKIKVQISKTPGSSQKRWITLQAKNQKIPVNSNFQAGINLYKISCPQSNSNTGVTSSCPKGTGGKVCSGNGSCNASTGSCNCSSNDYSGNACQIMSQRCYGAIGDNCGAADGFNFGLCIGNRCKINAGSWQHDECCVTFRKNGTAPASRQGSCTPPPFASGPYAKNCLVLFDKAVAHLSNPALTWERRVNTSKKRSGVGSFKVNHADMCNKPGGTLRCSDSKYCCSKRVNKTPLPGVCQCR